MTNEQIRIKIAEAVGWKRFPEGTVVEHTDYGATVLCRDCQIVFFSHNPCFCVDFPDHKWTLELDHWKLGSRWKCEWGLPDFPFDLNACAEFEKTLTDEQWMAYEDEIYEVTLRDDKRQVCRHFSATALQKCEAFLRALQLYKEDTV